MDIFFLLIQTRYDDTDADDDECDVDIAKGLSVWMQLDFLTIRTLCRQRCDFVEMWENKHIFYKLHCSHQHKNCGDTHKSVDQSLLNFWETIWLVAVVMILFRMANGTVLGFWQCNVGDMMLRNSQCHCCSSRWIASCSLFHFPPAHKSLLAVAKFYRTEIVGWEMLGLVVSLLVARLSSPP